MEFNATLVGVIITVLMLVPVVFLIMSTSGKDNKAKKSVSQLSQKKWYQFENHRCYWQLRDWRGRGFKKIGVYHKEKSFRRF